MASCYPGLGSEFTVRLPLLDAPKNGTVDPDRPLSRSERTLNSRKVLVVDDNVDAADTLVMLLELHGQEAKAAYDGTTALEQAAIDPPDIAFLDLEPAMNFLL